MDTLEMEKKKSDKQAAVPPRSPEWSVPPEKAARWAGSACMKVLIGLEADRGENLAAQLCTGLAAGGSIDSERPRNASPKWPDEHREKKKM